MCKYGLVDVGVRFAFEEKTCFVVLLGGVGILDEIFEILVFL